MKGIAVLVVLGIPVAAQRGVGELRLTVRDATGLPLEASVELKGQATQVQLSFASGREGRWTAKALPFGRYALRVERSGFAPWSELIEIRSEAPLEQEVTLGVAALETTVTITDADTLLDPHRTGPVFWLGAESLRERRASQPGRGVVDLVQTTPGWLLEANGVLHPRGSEYETQYVIDGIPITDNRSPSFAPALDVDEFQSMNVFTANYPAEYGRKLGGVIEVTTAHDPRPGGHGRASFERGSFGTLQGHVSGQYSAGRTIAGGSLQSARTDRFLDPPSPENFSNRGSETGGSARLERDFTDRDRLRLYVHSKRVGFLVPNEEEQEEAGQRQDRRNSEIMGHLSYQHVFSPQWIGQARLMTRELSARLWSNPLATPLAVDQDRGFRETYSGATLSYHRSVHEAKAGVEAIFTSVQERFSFPRFYFADRRQGREQAAFVQDLIRLGPWTLSTGLRCDRYGLLVTETAVSPRVGVAYHIPAASLVLRASYDRAFQTPAIENLLLASSGGDPVPPSRGDFYQAGFARSLGGRLRLDASYFRRRLRDFADDDVLLNTGVSFPIAFARADIHGFEARLEVPRWGPVSGYLSYGNLAGKGYLPITGGLFLETGSTGSFPITQDQRNTAAARFRWQLHRRAWLSFGAWYGSGLPVEIEEDDQDELDEVDPRILRRVNLPRGRVRPSYSLDLSGGVELWKHEEQALRLQAETLNLTDCFNVINFAGLFSGTALGAPRSFTLRLQAEF
jgi:outer membrane cobalamin receptor